MPRVRFLPTTGPGLGEFLRFSIVGSSGIFVNLGGYLLLTRLAGVSLEVASPIAIETSIIWNFVLNDRWTFGYRELQASRLVRLLRFHAVCAFGGVLNYAVLVILVNLFAWWDVYANLAGIALGMIAKFMMNSAWTWRRTAAGSRG